MPQDQLRSLALSSTLPQYFSQHLLQTRLLNPRTPIITAAPPQSQNHATRPAQKFGTVSNSLTGTESTPQIQPLPIQNHVRGLIQKLNTVFTEIKTPQIPTPQAQHLPKLRFNRNGLPTSWSPMADDQDLALINVAPGTPEWIKVENKVKETLSATISKIERIQNKQLWTIFSSNEAYIKLKNKTQQSNVVDLFHGTRGTPPSMIYTADGFDMRFCGSGMWGIACSFAVNASYSNSYAHPSPQGKQFFLASVILGDYITLASDSGLRVPPHKDQAAKNRYDSVKGNTGGSDVFMIYENKRAYPNYLITFT